MGRGEFEWPPIFAHLLSYLQAFGIPATLFTLRPGGSETSLRVSGKGNLQVRCLLMSGAFTTALPLPMDSKSEYLPLGE